MHNLWTALILALVTLARPLPIVVGVDSTIKLRRSVRQRRNPGSFETEAQAAAAYDRDACEEDWCSLITQVHNALRVLVHACAQQCLHARTALHMHDECSILRQCGCQDVGVLMCSTAVTNPTRKQYAGCSCCYSMEEDRFVDGPLTVPCGPGPGIHHLFHPGRLCIPLHERTANIMPAAQVLAPSALSHPTLRCWYSFFSTSLAA